LLRVDAHRARAESDVQRLRLAGDHRTHLAPARAVEIAIGRHHAHRLRVGRQVEVELLRLAGPQQHFLALHQFRAERGLVLLEEREEVGAFERAGRLQCIYAHRERRSAAARIGVGVRTCRERDGHGGDHGLRRAARKQKTGSSKAKNGDVAPRCCGKEALIGRMVCTQRAHAIPFVALTGQDASLIITSELR